MTGRVLVWFPERGYGKIRGHQGADRRSYFAHASELVEVLALTPGLLVEFNVVETGKGPRAVEVIPLEGSGRR